jgi:mono/diheme cytochrome c family protein
MRGRAGSRAGTAAALRAAVVLCAALLVGRTSAAGAQTLDADAVKRGEYILNLAGCASCHTDEKNKGAPLAGGVAIKTPFGTFYGPNITPDPKDGLGAWTEAEFIRALREGVGRDGSQLFPVFPFTSFTKMSDADAKDLWAYLRSVPPSPTPNKAHDVGFPFNVRLAQMGWKLLFFTPGRFQPDPAKSEQVNRGAYVAQALSHCGECHTPRNALGGLKTSEAFAGNPKPPEGDKVPNITPDPESGLGKWSDADIAEVLKSGMTPDGDFVGSSMAEVVRNTSGKMTDGDMRAVVSYLRSLPPVHTPADAKKSD